MNKEQFLRGAVSNLESKLSATKAELAEMKASLPQIKHDKELETKLAELKQVINKPWKPSIGEECLVTFGGTKEQCTVLALHKNHVWVTSGKNEYPLTVTISRLTQAKGSNRKCQQLR